MWLETGSHMHRADQSVSSYRMKIKEQFGFVADPDKPLWKNVDDRLSQLTIAESYNGSSIRNKACHNICAHSQPPVGYEDLLGLGLPYCIKPASTSEMLTSTMQSSIGTFDRLSNNVRRMFTYREQPLDPDDSLFNPKMYF